MVRQVQIRKGAPAVKRGNGPNVQSQVIRRDVANVANPAESASYHASRLADRFQIAGRELANKFGQLGNSLVKASDVANQVEVDRLKEEAREFQMQAQLDFYEGKPSATDNEAYLYERERLEKVEKVADVKREQEFQRSLVRSERLRAIARTKDAERAATRNKLNEEFLRTGEVVPGVGVNDAHKDILVDFNAGIVSDKVSEKLMGLAAGKSGLSHREMLKTVLDTSNEVLKGMDPDTKASIIARVVKKQKPFIEKAIAADRVASISRQQQNAELSHASNFVDGKYNDPTTGVSAFLADVQRTSVAYGGDLNKAIQGATKQIVDRTVMSMRDGDMDAYQKATTFLNKVTRDNPSLNSIVHKNLTAARKVTFDASIKEASGELQRAIAEGDESAAAQLFTKHTQHHKHPSYLTAFKAYKKFVGDKTKATEGSIHAERWRTGNGAYDPKKARKHVDGEQVKMLQSEDYFRFIDDARDRNHVGAEAKKYLKSAISDVSALDDWEASEEGPGRGVDVAQAYNTLIQLPENLRDSTLGTDIGAAVFTGINALVTGGQDVVSASRSVLTSLRTKGDDLKALNKRIDFRSLYPGADGAPIAKTARAAETAFNHEILTAAAEKAGTSADVKNMSDIYDDAGRYLQTLSIITGQPPTEEQRADAIRRSLNKYVAVPNPEGSTSSKDVSFVKPHQNPAVAIAVRKIWEEASDPQDQFLQGASAIRTTMPFLISNESSIAPSLTDAPDEDAARGYMAVTGGDDLYGQTITLAPGEDLTGVGHRDIEGLGVQTFEANKKFPATAPEFLAEVEGMNRLMADSPFQWLRRPGSNDANPVYYLGFRPKPAGFAPQSTLPGLQSIAETATDAFTEAERKIRGLVPRAQGSTLPIAPGAGSEPDSAPEARGRVIKEIIGNLTKSPESTVPRSLGLTVEIPDRFETDDDAIDWLRTAVNTHTINNKGARAPSLANPQLPDHDNTINYLAGWNGNSTVASTDAVYRNRQEIGIGVPVTDDWVQSLLMEKAGYSSADVKDIVDGRKRLSDSALKLVNMEAVGRAHQTLASKIDSKLLAEMPFDARMVLTGIVIDGDKALTPDIVDAVNARDWQGAALAIRGATAGVKNKRFKANLERKRVSEAAQFEIALGLGTGLEF